MSYKFSRSFISKTQLTLTFLVAISALFGGLGLMITNGLGMSSNILAPTPFKSFLIPGLMLAGIVGGTQIWAFYKLLNKQIDAQFFTAVAGFGLLIWLFVEVYWLLHTSPLQPVYFMLGILELMSVLGVLNVAPWLVQQKSNK